MDMLVSLLAAIYRPHNHYCLHMDAKSQPTFHKIAARLSECLPAIKIPKVKVKVEAGKMSVIRAEISCMRTLFPLEWEYYINLSGEDYPLKTNLELVRILKSLQGANDVWGRYV